MKMRLIIVLALCTVIISTFSLRERLFLQRPFFQKGRLLKIPLEYDEINHESYVKAKIEDGEYYLLLDWGLPGAWMLQSRILEKIKHKHIEGTFTFRDLKGNVYSSSAIRLPLIKIAGKEFENALGIEEQKKFIEEGCVIWTSNEVNEATFVRAGSVGRDLFKNWNLIFDLSNDTLYLTMEESADYKKRNHHNTKAFSEVPFVNSRTGTVISVETDLGIRRFLLDTGATHSFLRNSDVKKEEQEEFKPGRWRYATKKFVCGNLDFGKTDFVLYELTSIDDDIDGILGVDFFYKYCVFLDFQNNIAVISK